jgi:hypothetical protein
LPGKIQSCIKKIATPVENVNMRTPELLTPAEMAYTLGITEYTLNALARNGTIPHTYIPAPVGQTPLLRFDPFTVMAWLQTNPETDHFTEKSYIDGLKHQYQTRFPHVISALQSVDAQFSPPNHGKGFSLSKVKSKKYGFLYYVRYIENGKLVHSR